MFSGLVETTSAIKRITPEPGGILISVERPEGFTDVSIGDSIAIDGCCLTVVAMDAESLEFQAGEETLSKTTLGELTTSELVNCERSLALGDRIGGHLVTGHIDGLAELRRREDTAEWSDMFFETPGRLLKQMAAKASVAVNGVSLTLVDVTPSGFSVALIPHTLAATTMGGLQVGDKVNVETDLLAKYVEQQLAHRG